MRTTIINEISSKEFTNTKYVYFIYPLFDEKYSLVYFEDKKNTLILYEISRNEYEEFCELNNDDLYPTKTEINFLKTSIEKYFLGNNYSNLVITKISINSENKINISKEKLLEHFGSIYEYNFITDKKILMKCKIEDDIKLLFMILNINKLNQ